MLLKNFYEKREVEGTSPYLRNNILGLIELFNVKGSIYLDVGIGTGEFTCQMSEKIMSEKTYGIDISSESVRMAKIKGIIAKNIDVNNEKLPFPDNFFDVITATDVIEHLNNSDFFLEEVNRVLKHNGYFLVSSPNIGSWISILSLIFGFLPPSYEVSFKHRVGKPFGKRVSIPLADKPVGHIKPYNLRSLKQHLMLNDFDIITVSSTRIFGGKGILRFIGYLDAFFSHFKRYSEGLIFLTKKI